MEPAKPISARAARKAATAARHNQIREDALAVVNRFPPTFGVWSLQRANTWDALARKVRALARRKSLRTGDVKRALDAVKGVSQMTEGECAAFLARGAKAVDVDPRQISIVEE